MDPYLAGKIKDMTIIGQRLANQLSEFKMLLECYIEGIDTTLERLNELTELEIEKHSKTDGTGKENQKP